jgi:hypothetical protein
MRKVSAALVTTRNSHPGTVPPQSVHCSKIKKHLEKALQRHNTKNLKEIFPEKELRCRSPNFHIHVYVSDLYISRIGPHIFLHQNRQTDVEIGTEAAQFLF